MDIRAAATSFTVKLIAFVAVVAVCAGASWYVRGLLADAEVIEAKETTRQEVSAEYTAKIAETEANERAARIASDARYNELTDKLNTIQKDMRGIRYDIALDRATNQEFYKQSLPPAGYAAWVQTRQAVQKALTGKGGQK